MAAIQQALLAYGASASGSTHRYWRLLVTSNNGHAYTGIATLAMRESLGGTDVAAAGGSALGNDSIFTAEPYRAFDSNGATIWATNAAGDRYVGKDFGASSADWKAILEIAITTSRSFEGPPSMAPQDAELQYSDDGSSWTTSLSISGQTGWANEETRTFS